MKRSPNGGTAASKARTKVKAAAKRARKPAALPMSDGPAGVKACIASMEPWQMAIAKRVDALVAKLVPGKPL
jgi:hypothetical protein